MLTAQDFRPFSLAQSLQAGQNIAADPHWPEIENDPATLEALVRKMRSE